MYKFRAYEIHPYSVIDVVSGLLYTLNWRNTVCYIFMIYGSQIQKLELVLILI